MKKNILFFVCFLLVAVNAYSDQTLNGRQPREYNQSTQNKILEGNDYTGDLTAVTGVVATGHQATGNAGMVALQSQDGNGNNITYYLWVDTSTATTGVLRMASFPNIKTFSSFPYGDMRGGVNGFNAGGKVASQ